MYYIYQIKNLITGRSYIGKSNNALIRTGHHFLSLRNGKHVNRFFQLDYNKYGENSFVWGVIRSYKEKAPSDRAEVRFIKKNSVGYNVKHNKKLYEALHQKKNDWKILRVRKNIDLPANIILALTIDAIHRKMGIKQYLEKYLEEVACRLSGSTYIPQQHIDLRKSSTLHKEYAELMLEDKAARIAGRSKNGTSTTTKTK